MQLMVLDAQHCYRASGLVRDQQGLYMRVHRRETWHLMSSGFAVRMRITTGRATLDSWVLIVVY